MSVQLYEFRCMECSSVVLNQYNVAGDSHSAECSGVLVYVEPHQSESDSNQEVENVDAACDNNEQIGLFENPPAWKEKWNGMPEFDQKNLLPWQTIKVHFRNQQDRLAFAKFVGQKLSSKTQYIWFPEAKINQLFDKRYKSSSEVVPRYPVYVISKGRWESRQTVKALETIGTPYMIVIEPQEYDAYAAVISTEKILQLPFSNLGQGSIPARNWVWEHSISEGHQRHWILDDNISVFYRLYENKKIAMADSSAFCVVEDFADRYENVAIAGLNYRGLAKQAQVIPPFYLNTRIYSCILIENDIDYRWRGRYNEDTDLSLRVLKDGLCTVLFNAFLAGKTATMTMKGGNTDELYKDDGRLKMAQSLQEQHPDVVRISQKFGRYQHHVDYKPFKTNKLILKPDAIITDVSDKYEIGIDLLDT